MKKALWLNIFVLIFAWSGVIDAAARCANSADVPDSMCKFFHFYGRSEAAKVDDRISSRLLAPTGSDVPVRSFAFIISINDYPNFPDPNGQKLSPAKNDLKNLEIFMREQSFDEVIVLENETATKGNIDYFLDIYLNKQLDLYKGRSRVLVAHTGHGGPGDTRGTPGSIILSRATGDKDYDNIYPLATLTPKLINLAGKAFHFVAFLGACYSGGVFPPALEGGDNNVFSKAPGAHAVSATTPDDLAYGLSGQSGSIFFDTIIRGVRTGQADPLFAGWVAADDGSLHMIGGGIVRLGALTSYVSGSVERLGTNPRTGKDFPQLQFGSLITHGERGGAFFFLGPRKRAEISVAVSSEKVSTADTGSALVNRPQIKVFSPPDSYRIFGIDVSHYNGLINWNLIKSSNFKVVYMKATESVTLIDSRFERNWSETDRLGILKGAYHVFDFCEKPERQFDLIKRVVPKNKNSLPLAIDLLWDGVPISSGQKKCSDVEVARKNIARLASLIKSYYGKSAVVYGSRKVFTDLIDDRFSDNPVWLQVSVASNNVEKIRSLGGRNPWTLWQFTARGKVAGIKGAVDLNAFYGTEEALVGFTTRSGNAALNAAVKGTQ